MKTRFIALLWLVALLPLHAATESRSQGVAVRIWGRADIAAGQPGDLTISGTFLHPDPSVGGNQNRSATSSTTSGGTVTTNLGATTNGIVRLEPDKAYKVIIGGQNLRTGELNIIPPAGYQVLIDGTPRTRTTYNGAWLFYVQVVANDSARPNRAAQASNAGATAVEWHVSVGQLLNGTDAGVVSLIDSGTRADWSPLFTPSALDFETASDEVWVHRVWDTVRQVISNEVAVDIVTLNATSYEMRFYNPSQVANTTSTPRTFNGSPYVTYRVSQGATSKTLSFTKEIRDVTSTNLNPPISRTEIMNLAQSQTWPNFIWTRSPWTAQGQGAVNETIAQSAGTGTARASEAVGMRPVGATANTVENYRTYTNIPGVGEAVATERMGSGGNNPQSTFDYYTSTASPGNLGYVKSATYADGGWDAYQYYDPGTALTTRAGTVQHRFRPFVNSPASPGFNTAVGEVTSFDYVNDEFGAQRAPSQITTKINNVPVARTSFAYTYTVRYANDHGVNRIERTDYSGNTTSMTTVVCTYMLNWGDSIYRGQLFSVTTPDNVRRSYAYEKGTWNGTTFVFTPGVGNASRTTEITGTATAGSGALIQSHNAEEVEPVYLVDGKSVAETTVRDSRALVVRKETAVWSSGAWRITGWTNYTYNFGGELTARSSSNGAQYSAVYTGGLKTSETDEQGITTTYTHDSAGRVETATRQGSGVIGTLVFKYSYDAAGNRTEERVGWGQLDQIIASAQFDNSGRITSETRPGQTATTHSYNVASRTHTITKPSGATVIEALNVDGQLASLTGTGVVPVYHTYGVDAATGQRYAQLNSGASSSPRWSKRWVDWLGRVIKTEHPGFTGQPNVIEQFFYDSVGRLTKTTKTGYAAQLLEYNVLSQIRRTGLDADGSNTLDNASTDRIAESDTYLESYSSAYWLRTDTKVYAQLGLGTVTQISTSRYRLTGHPAGRLVEILKTDPENNTTTLQFTVNRSARTAARVETRSGISGSRTTNYVNGFPRTVVDFDGLTTTFGYDTLLRRTTVTDTRDNTATTAYQPGTTRPLFVTDAANGQVLFGYDTSGRLTSRRDERNHYTRYEYNARDQIFRQWGDGTHPVEYGFDATYGDLTAIRTFRAGSGWEGATWPSSPGPADTTTMAYDGPSGLLTTKTDALNRAVTQTYNERGQTAVRTLARGVSATYAYSAATGELTGINYSDTTPDVSFTYTRLGQLDSATDVTGTRDFIYDSAKPWRLSAEALSSFYNSKVLTRLYEAAGVLGRNDGFKLGASAGSNSDLEQDYGYLGNGRFETLATKVNSNATTRTFRYAYLSNAELISSVSIDGSHPFTMTRSYEATRDLVTSYVAKWSTTVRTQFDYAYDERRMRKSVVQAGDAFSDYGDATHRLFTYNGRGELTADIGFLNSNPTSQTDPLPGRRHEFAFDQAGNRQTSNRTGVADLAEAYATNALNQYVSRENNTLIASGTADPAAKIAVKGQAVLAGRKGRYWSDEVVVNNALRPWYGSLTIYTAKAGAGSGGNDLYKTDSRNAWLAAALQNFTYDHDGNLTSDGIWDYAYDAENRLVSMQTNSVAAGYGFPNRLLQFKYDYAGRRVQKRVVNLSNNTEVSSRRFLYDGNNLVAEWNAPGGTSIGTLVRSYTWGLDVTQSLHGTAGIGGLLEIRDHASGKTYLPSYDGNGNVTALLNASTGAVAAVYEYSTFGEAVRAQVNDSTVADQPLRFSTQFYDVETGLYAYARRYYDPRNGRFINRDPIAESGGLNLYGFVGNNPVNRWDVLGYMYTLPVMHIEGSPVRDLAPFEAFAISAPRLSVGSMVNNGGVLYEVTGDAGVDANGIQTWNGIPVGQSLASQAQSDIQQAAAQAVSDANAAMAASLPQMQPLELPQPLAPASNLDSALNGIQLALSGAGVALPGIGDIADIVNAGISLARGDFVGAGMDLVSALPFVGMSAGVARFGDRFLDVTRAAESRTVTVLGSGRDVAKYAGKEGFNVLDMSKVPQAEWARTNAEWLNKALRNGDDIWLVTDPAKHTQLMQQLGKQSYYLDLELPMLEQFGARAVPKFVPATPP